MTTVSTSLDRSLSFVEQLDASHITPVMRSVWALSAGLIALDGFDFFIIGIALPFLRQDFHLSSLEVGAVAVATVAGALVGSITLGAMTDRIGRQRMLIVDVILFVVATTGSVFAWNALSLIIFRFFVGVAIGADYPISVAYITENVPSRHRGQLVIGAFTFQAVGAFLGALTGLVILYSFQALDPDANQAVIHYGWRWMLGVGLILAIAIAGFRFTFLLESPLYYIAKQDYEAASEAASILLGKPIVITIDTDSPNQVPQYSYGSLFSPEFRRHTWFASLPWFLQDIATYGVGIFTPIIIASLAFSQEANFIQQEIAATRGAAIVDLFLITGFLLAVLLIERVGRIRLQIIGFIGMAIGLLILALPNLIPVNNDLKFILVITGFIIFNLTMNAGPNSTTFLLSGEVFPTSIRASGSGFAAAVAKAGAILGTFTLPIFEVTWGLTTLMLLLAVCCGVAALLTYVLRPLTLSLNSNIHLYTSPDIGERMV